jgi:TonB family protein
VNKIYLAFAILIVLSGNGISLAGQNEDMAAFDLAYTQYEEYYSQGALSQSVQAAERAYQLGERLFGAKSEDFANLAYNYANNLSQLGNFEDSIAVYSDSLKAFEAVHGKNSMELAPALMGLGHASAYMNNNRTMKKSFNRVLKLAEKSFGKNSAEFGWYSVKAGVDILNLAEDRTGEKHLRTGFKALQSTLGEGHARTGFAAYHLGTHELAGEDFESARDYFLSTLNSFENPWEPQNRLQLSTHALLIHAYEELGERDKATRHCLAIGRMTPFESNQDYFPIYKVAPRYSNKAINRGSEGFVTLEFTVDESGFIQNPVMVASEGHKDFEKAAYEAAGMYRYAPRFVDGSPVSVDGVQNRFTFSLQRSSHWDN